MSNVSGGKRHDWQGYALEGCCEGVRQPGGFREADYLPGAEAFAAKKHLKLTVIICHNPISIIEQPLFVENPKIKRDLILNQGTKVSEESSRWEGVVDVL